MSVAGASLLVAVALIALACANWLWLRADVTANASHLKALADVALVTLAIHALALIVAGRTSPPAYGLTVVLACAAAAVRRPSPPTAAERDAGEATDVGADAPPAEPSAPRTTPWSS